MRHSPPKTPHCSSVLSSVDSSLVTACDGLAPSSAHDLFRVEAVYADLKIADGATCARKVTKTQAEQLNIHDWKMISRIETAHSHNSPAVAVDDPIHNEGDLRGRAAIQLELQQIADLRDQIPTTAALRHSGPQAGAASLNHFTTQFRSQFPNICISQSPLRDF